MARKAHSNGRMWAIKMAGEVAVQNLKLESIKAFRNQLEWAKIHDQGKFAEAISNEALDLLARLLGKSQASAPAFPSERWL
jgi:hypothetical protein